MSTTKIKTRIQNKHDITANWSQATFTSLPGEFYVYDDYSPPKLKIGDGVHAVKDLPFEDNDKVIVKGGLKQFTGGMTIHTGDIITIKIDKSKITSSTNDSWTTVEGVNFIFNHGNAANGWYGWNTDPYGAPYGPGSEGTWEESDGEAGEYLPNGFGFSIPENIDDIAEEYTFIYTGETCTLSQEDANCECTTFNVDKGPQELVYLQNGVETELSIFDDLNNLIEAKQDKITENSKLSIDYISGLANVATSGSYNDLADKPSIPTVNNGTLTIKQNGEVKGTFTANNSGDVTVELSDSVTELVYATEDDIKALWK